MNPSDRERNQGRPDNPDARRLELLERENERLRRQVEAIIGPDNPCFDRTAFQNAMRFYMMIFMLPLQVLFVPMLVLALHPGWAPNLPNLGPVRLLDLGGAGTTHPGFGLGIFAIGGLSCGIVAFGGLAVGLVAIGGGAIGVLAIGGGAVGVLALGGGAVGYIAVGGGAVGRYALGGGAKGRHVFSLRRQDPKAVELFVRWLPRFRPAVTTPLPVVSLSKDESPHEP